MKQGTNTIMQIEIDYDLSLIEKIAFKFEQGAKCLLFNYPSENAYRKDEEKNVICLEWTYEQTFMFTPGSKVGLDTLIKLKDGKQNPHTHIVRLDFEPTLFTQEEVEDFD